MLTCTISVLVSFQKSSVTPYTNILRKSLQYLCVIWEKNNNLMSLLLFPLSLCLIWTVGKSCSWQGRNPAGCLGWLEHCFCSMTGNAGAFWGQICCCCACHAETLMAVTKHRWAPQCSSSRPCRKAVPGSGYQLWGWRWHTSASPPSPDCHGHADAAYSIDLPQKRKAFSGVITAFQANIFLNVTRKLLIPYGKALCIFAGQQTNCC